MNMCVKNGLPAVAVRVYHNAISCFGETLVPGDLRRGQKKVPERFPVRNLGFIQRFDMPARHDQDMRRRLRAYVVEGNALAVLEHLVRRNTSLNHFAENTVFRTHNN